MDCKKRQIEKVLIVEPGGTFYIQDLRHEHSLLMTFFPFFSSPSQVDDFVFEDFARLGLTGMTDDKDLFDPLC